MLPDPMHPAVVHFPIVLMFLVPIFAGAALFAIRKGATSAAVWMLPVVAAGALALSAWLSVRTGSAQEDRVERVVAHGAFETHEESAETFLALSVALLVVSAAGLVRGRIGEASRLVTTLGAVALVGVGARVGHTGGMLVYREGAASAYTAAQPGGAAGEQGRAQRQPSGDRDSDDNR